jgi:hypothetical protein
LDEESPPVISIREFIERILEERDRLYTVRFEASKTAVDAALIAQKESVANAFLSSEKAIVKAEEAQKAYNVAHNDLSRKMDEQSKGTIPRSEIMVLLRVIEDKVEAQRLSHEKSSDNNAKALSDIRLAMTLLLSTEAYEIRHAQIQQQVNDLLKSRSENTGKSVGANALWSYFIATVGVIVGITAVIFHFIK